MSVIRVYNECLMICYISYVYICTFLVDMRNIVYDFWILFLRTSFSRWWFLILIFGFNSCCHLRLLTFIFRGLAGSYGGGWATSFDCCRFNQRVWTVTLSQGLRLNDLSSIIGCSLIRIVIGLISFHINFITLSRRCCSTSLTMLLLSNLIRTDCLLLPSELRL